MAELEKLGRYEIVGELGRGGMGIVLKGRDPHIDRDVALKIVKLDEVGNSTNDKEMLKRFYIEAKAAGKLQHPGIVTVYDAGEDQGRSYIAMEFVDGEDLSDLLKREGPLPVKRAAELIKQVAEGLSYAHEQGVIHRDIKPGNILINRQGAPKITDFGLARFQASGSVTQTGHAVGSPSYMSPEQVQGKPVDGRSDLFSLGVMFYELITAVRPFEGESLTTLIYKIIQEEPIPPHDIVTSIPPLAENIIARLLSKDINKRFRNGAELVAALAPLVTGHTSAPVTHPSFGAIDTTATIDFDSSSELHHVDPVRSGSGKKIAITLALLIAAGWGSWSLLGGHRGEVSAPPHPQALASPPPPQQRPSLISVDAIPPGEVFIDDVFAGQAPLKEKSLKPGRRVITVMAKGYRTWREEITATPGEKLTLRAELHKTEPKVLTGQLVVTGPRGATVRVDGDTVGVAPLTRNLPPGDHTVVLSHTGYTSRRQSVTIAADEKVGVDLTLKKRGVGVLVVAAMPWAEIYLDGVKVGTTPKKMTKVYEGKRRIRLVHPNYRPFETTFNISSGKRTIVRHTFAPDEERGKEGKKKLSTTAVGVLSVTARPVGRLFVDGKRRGKTPLKLTDITAGKHEIILKRPGYADYRRDVTIIKGRITRLSIE